MSLFALRRISISSGEGLQAIVFFSGQVVINNFDIVLVKHFFAPEQAGIYAAVSLVGRLVNMCAWSVVNTMFPVSAAARSSDREARPVLFMSLFLVFLILSVLILGLWAIPSFLWRTLFGSHFELQNFGGLAALLILYAVTTGIYSLSSVMITYEMSRKIANTSWVQLAFSGALVIGICLFHTSLRQVIFVQLILMVILLVMVALAASAPRDRAGGTPDLLQPSNCAAHETRGHLRIPAQRVSSPGVRRIPAGVRTHRERTRPESLAKMHCDGLSCFFAGARCGGNFRRTRVVQGRLARKDLERIRFFPRAQWRRVAEGSFYLTDMVDSLRLKWQESPDDEFFRKLQLLKRSGSGRPGEPDRSVDWR